MSEYVEMRTAKSAVSDAETFIIEMKKKIGPIQGTETFFAKMKEAYEELLLLACQLEDRNDRFLD